MVIAGVGVKISKSIDVNRFDISKWYLVGRLIIEEDLSR